MVLRVFDTAGTQVMADGLSWDQHQITRDLPAGEYRVKLTIGTADSPFAH